MEFFETQDSSLDRLGSSGAIPRHSGRHSRLIGREQLLCARYSNCPNTNRCRQLSNIATYNFFVGQDVSGHLLINVPERLRISTKCKGFFPTEHFSSDSI